MSPDMVLQSVLFSLALFYSRNLVFFFFNLVWNSIHTVDDPSVKCIGVLVSLPIYQSFCSVLRPRNKMYCLGGCVYIYIYIYKAADIMLNMLSNTLLT